MTETFSIHDLLQQVTEYIHKHGVEKHTTLEVPDLSHCMSLECDVFTSPPEGMDPIYHLEQEIQLLFICLNNSAVNIYPF